MRRGAMAILLLGLLGTMPLSGQETRLAQTAPTASPDGQSCPVEQTVAASSGWVSIADEAGVAEPLPWQTAWGLVGLRIIPAGVKTAPNSAEYHPNFSIDLDIDFWIWRSQGLYLFADMRLWGEKGENGVTNSRDGFFATSKREFDALGGVAWNYAGAWEARAFGYTDNNLNRGNSQLVPSGFTDGFCLENRYYLSPEYAKLGQTGFDVAKATFLSIGYYPTKDLVGNDGQSFKPGLMLRAYLTYDLWDWTCYLFGDATYISERSFRPRLLLFDVGLAARPFHSCRQFELRIGAENTGDLQVHNVQSLGYLSLRYIY